MSTPATRLPGAVPTGTGFTGGGGIAAGQTGEWRDCMPPDDARPVVLSFSLVGAGPGVIQIQRASRAGAAGPPHVADIPVPAVLPLEEYVFTFDRPIPNGALRFRYTNNSGAEVFPLLEWTYTAPGRR